VGEDDVGEDDVGEDASLPPPISRSDGVRIWLVVAGASTAVLAVSWLAGAPPLSLPVGSGEDAFVPELGPGARLVGLARTLVYLPLATFGATFGFLALAFVRQRPVGHLGALLAKSAAIVSVGMLVWLVPSDVRFIKQILNVAVVPLVAGALAVPVLRLAPREVLFRAADPHAGQRAGTPLTLASDGTSRATTAPAPTMARAPTDRPGSTTAPAPTMTPAPTVTPPQRIAPGARCASSPRRQSCSTMARVFTIAPRPIEARACTTAITPTYAAGATSAEGETTAVGSTIEAKASGCRCPKQRRHESRSMASPTAA